MIVKERTQLTWAICKFSGFCCWKNIGICIIILKFLNVRKKAVESISHSVISDTLQPLGLEPSRLLWPWHSPGKNIGVGCHALLQGIFLIQGLNPSLCLLHCQVGALPLAPPTKVAQSCLTLCDPMDYAAHGILQARILEWVAFPFSRGSSQPRNWTRVSCITGGFFTNWALREALITDGHS